MTEVRLLGGASILDEDGRPMRGPATHRHRLALLSLLAVAHPGSVSRDRLLALLWPERDTPYARNLLNQAVHAVRKVFGSGAIRASGQDELSLDCDIVRTDVHAFRAALADGRLERAVELYRGELLSGFFLPDASTLEHWVDTERARLLGRYATALERLAETAEVHGEWDVAVKNWRAVLAIDPAHARITSRLMLALEASGDRASAIRQADVHAEILDDLVGAGPHPDIVALADRMREGPTRSLPIHAGGIAHSALVLNSTGARTSPVPLHMLVGREIEVAQLHQAWERTSSGGIHMALIRGVAGIGKTRLAEELLDWAARNGAETARSRSHEQEGRLALAPVVEWLRSDAMRVRWTSLEPVWHRELARLLPEIVQGRPHSSPPEPLTDTWQQRRRLFDALAQATLASADPLVLLLDDLQWTDSDTLEWLHYLLRQETSSRLLLVGTARSEEITPGHPLTPLVRELRLRARITEIGLDPLDAPSTIALATQVAEQPPSAEEAAAIHAWTEGHPLFVVESVRARRTEAPGGSGAEPAAAMPTTVQAVIRSRLAQLSPPARSLAGLAGTIGREFGFRVLKLAADASADELAEGLDELWQRRVVRTDGSDVWDFTHDRLREAAVADLPPARRVQFHLRVASALESVHAPDTEAVAARIAAHYERGHEPARAIPFHRQAADVALRVLAVEEADAHLRRAIALVGSLMDAEQRTQVELELQLERGSSLTLIKGWSASEVAEVYRRARTLGEATGAADDRLRILWGLMTVNFVAATGKGRRIAREFADAVNGTRNPALHAAAQHGLGLQAYASGELERAERHFEDAMFPDGTGRQSADLNRADLGVLNLAFLSHTLQHCGRTGEASRRSREAIRRANEFAQPFDRTMALAYAAMFHHFQGDIDATERLARETRAVASKHSFSYYCAWSDILEGWAAAERGDLGKGLDVMRAGLVAMDDAGGIFRRPYYLGLVATAAIRSGDTAQASPLISEALDRLCSNGERWAEADILRRRAELLCAKGRDVAAEGDLRHALDVAHEQGAAFFGLRAVIALARLQHRRGEPAAARRTVETMLEKLGQDADTPLLGEALTLGRP